MPTLYKMKLIGHLGKDAQVSKTQKGKDRVSFSLAVNTGSEKQNTRQVHWIYVNVYGWSVEQAASFRKGDCVFVEGEPSTFLADNSEAKPEALLSCTCFNCYKIAWKKREQVQDRKQEGSFSNQNYSDIDPAVPPPGFGNNDNDPIDDEVPF